MREQSLMITCDNCGKQEFVTDDNSLSKRRIITVSIEDVTYDVCNEVCALKIAQKVFNSLFENYNNLEGAK